MRTLFLLNPTAGKADCTRTLPQQINVAAARAGLAPEEYTIQVTNHAGHARELANAAAQQARQSGEELRVFTAGGDGTFNEALTGIYGYANAAVGCLPFGSGNDFLRTFGTKEEFLDLDAQLAGGPVSIDLMQTSLGHLRCRSGCAGCLRHPEVPAHPAVRRRDGLCAFHCGTAVRAHRPQGGVYHRW